MSEQVPEQVQLHLCGTTLLLLRDILLPNQETDKARKQEEGEEEGKMCWKGTSKLNGLLAGVR